MISQQVSKNICNKNDSDVGLLRTVKNMYGYKKNRANNKIGMGLVISHTYNLSHAYLSHTPHTVKHPTSVALLRATEWLDDSRQDAWSNPKVLALL